MKHRGFFSSSTYFSHLDWDVILFSYEFVVVFGSHHDWQMNRKKTVHTRTDVSIRCVAFTEHMPVIRNASIRRCRDTVERNMFEIEIIKSFPSIDENQAKWQCGVSKWIRAHTIGGWEIMRSSIVLSQTHMRWCVVWHGTAVRTYLVNVFERR